MVEIPIFNEKDKLRKRMKRLRNEAFVTYGGDVAMGMADRFLSWIRTIKNLHNIAFYYPIKTEVDPFPLVEALAGYEFRFCLPEILEHGAPLVFKEWKRGEKLINSSYGTKVPASGELLIPDLIITPLLAFDEYGFRLGYGGGFYDRTILKLKENGQVLVVGLAFECQRVTSRIPIEETDQKIDCALTQKGFYFFDYE